MPGWDRARGASRPAYITVIWLTDVEAAVYARASEMAPAKRTSANATVVGVAAAAGTAGFRFVRDRVVVGGTPVATRRSPVSGGGYIHLPDGWRSPRSAQRQRDV